MENANLLLYSGLVVFAAKGLPIVGGMASMVDGLASGLGVVSLSALAIGVGALLHLLK